MISASERFRVNGVLARVFEGQILKLLKPFLFINIRLEFSRGGMAWKRCDSYDGY